MQIIIDSKDNPALFDDFLRWLAEQTNGDSEDLPMEGYTQTNSATRETLETDLDAFGFPWDARINASTKTKTGAGVWKKLKGVSDELYSQVQTILRAQYPAPAPAAPLIPPAPAATVHQLAPPAPAMPTSPPPAPTAEPAVDWKQICALVMDKTKTVPDIIARANEIAQKHDLKQWALIATRKSLWDEFYGEIAAI